MKKIIYMLFIMMILVGCHVHPMSEKNDLKIVVASDIHYFLRDYYKDCEWFEESMMYGDGKMVTYGDEILDAFEKAVIDIHPDLLVLTGDLTFNGEKGGHESLAQRLERISQEGVNVAVIPGNHDIENIYTKGYGKDDYFEVENITGKQFKSIYKNCGYHLASQEHKDSLSYVIPLNDDYTLLMMDSNYHELTGGNSFNTGGRFPESTLEWMENQLISIQKDGKIPLVAMHHNLTNHNELLNQGYTINDNQQVVDIFKKYHVPFVLSGHVHCQNIQQIEGIYDIASSSLVDAPLQYGVIELNHEKMSYHTQSLNISADSVEYFQTVSKNKMADNFISIKDENLRKEAIETMALVNYHYFAGTIFKIKKDVTKTKGYQAIMSMEDEFIKNYMKSMMNSDTNHISLNIDL